MLLLHYSFKETTWIPTFLVLKTFNCDAYLKHHIRVVLSCLLRCIVIRFLWQCTFALLWQSLLLIMCVGHMFLTQLPPIYQVLFLVPICVSFMSIKYKITFVLTNVFSLNYITHTVQYSAVVIDDCVCNFLLRRYNAVYKCVYDKLKDKCNATASAIYAAYHLAVEERWLDSMNCSISEWYRCLVI